MLNAIIFTKNQHANTCTPIASAFAVVMVLEYTTPPEYVFGYLYSGPILMANSRLGRSATLKITLTVAALTLLNLVLPTVESFNPSTLANRLIVVMALLVTGWLS